MIEVIGAGFGRTGTMSLKGALERLGYGPCHHMLELFDRPQEIRLWRQAARGEAVDWNEIYGDHRATVDWPGARFWRELIDHYPQAKVILTVRDPRRWYDSAAGSIYSAAMATDEGTNPVLTQMRKMSIEVVWDGVFDGRFADMQHAVKVFEQHIEEVSRAVPAERLLVFEVGQGWEPLCEFLDVPVPAEPFPHENDQKQFAARITDIKSS